MVYGIKRVLNDGKNLRDSKKVMTFLTPAGNRTPKYLWVGYSDTDFELTDMSKAGLISKIERDNRFFGKGGKHGLHGFQRHQNQS